jgi:hypothetical protein
MKAKDVPQEISMLEGHQRACYALGEDGRYTVVPSTGWEVEKIANAVAVDEIRATIEATRQRALRGEVSALEYHMLRCHMTPAMLAANAGIWTWRVRRHLRPAVFANLSPALLARYADALRMAPAELKQVPGAAA